jgi:hypothetical protein
MTYAMTGHDGVIRRLASTSESTSESASESASGGAGTRVLGWVGTGCAGGVARQEVPRDTP